MLIDRRRFLTLVGLATFGLVPKRLFDGLSGTGLVEARAAEAVKKRWGMVVRLGSCKDGCTTCIDACHRQHNVPDFGNAKDEIKWIWTIPFEESFADQRNEFFEAPLKGASVLALCNHCDNPACTRVCPTQATWKREDGIVMMDYHRCIGCRYCMAACPYGSRSFNWRDPRPFIKEINPAYPTRTKGVVEKCNFCEDRLAKGLAPACVEACPNNALVFGDLENSASDIRKLLSSQYTIRRKPGLGTEPKVFYLI